MLLCKIKFGIKKKVLFSIEQYFNLNQIYHTDIYI